MRFEERTDINYTVDIMTGDIVIQYKGKPVYMIQDPEIDGMQATREELHNYVSEWKDDILERIEEMDGE